jgi:predicted dithiol-disulfide oxidoreductase (DUF899 family)
MTDSQALPKIVSQQEWDAARAAFLVKEKEMTRARDALAAQRRRLPMVRIEKNYVFDGANGKVSLLELFEGRPQLLIYYFMFAPGVSGWPTAGCPGCSMFVDNIGQFALTHLAARDVSFTLASRAPLENLLAYKKRMSWSTPWVSSANNTFHDDLGLVADDGERHQLNVFLRDGNNIYRTYSTQARGSEGVGNVWGFLDATPFGRQEEWEDTPKGRPQSAPYQWWRRHDEY